VSEGRRPAKAATSIIAKTAAMIEIRLVVPAKAA
jgi:hypothetical protein